MDKCSECYARDFIKRSLGAAVSSFSQLWVRELCTSFTWAYTDWKGSIVARTKIKRYFTFFSEIDTHFTGRDKITADSLLTFGSKWLHCWIVPVNYLVKAQVIGEFPEEAYRMAIARERQAKIIGEFAGTWCGALLTEFQKHLWIIHGRYISRGWTGKLARFLPRTVTMDIRAAATFLTSLSPDILATTQIDQTCIDRFLYKYPGYRAGIGAFARYLNNHKKIFRRIKVLAIHTKLQPDAILAPQDYDALVKTLLNPDDASLKESLICLLLLLYGQSTTKVVKIRLSDISRQDENTYSITFQRALISIDQKVGALIERYLEARRALATLEEDFDNPYLFPGRKYGRHLETMTVQDYLRKHGATAATMFSSSMFYACLYGVEQPRTLMDGFGVSDQTAIKYYTYVSTRLRIHESVKAARKK